MRPCAQRGGRATAHSECDASSWRPFPTCRPVKALIDTPGEHPGILARHGERFLVNLDKQRVRAVGADVAFAVEPQGPDDRREVLAHHASPTTAR